MKISCVRHYHREDFDALVSLYQRSKGDEFRFEPGFPERFAIIPLSSDETRLQAFHECQALAVPGAGEGRLAVVIYWREHHIVGLLVDPDARGGGLGRRLMIAALARMQDSVTLEVVASNAPAIRLYEALGFESQGQRTGFYQGAAVTLLTMRRDAV